MAFSYDEWLAAKAKKQGAIRALHHDEGHSYMETAGRINLHLNTVKQRDARERKEPTVEVAAPSAGTGKNQHPLFGAILSHSATPRAHMPCET